MAEECRLGALQFHGAETPEDLLEHRLPVIKTLKVAGAADLARMTAYRVAAFLLDSPARGARASRAAPDSLGRGRARRRAGTRCSSPPGSPPTT